MCGVYFWRNARKNNANQKHDEPWLLDVVGNINCPATTHSVTFSPPRLEAVMWHIRLCLGKCKVRREMPIQQVWAVGKKKAAAACIPSSDKNVPNHPQQTQCSHSTMLQQLCGTYAKLRLILRIKLWFTCIHIYIYIYMYFIDLTGVDPKKRGCPNLHSYPRTTRLYNFRSD